MADGAVEERAMSDPLIHVENLSKIYWSGEQPCARWMT
jgi:hypothetical protein